MAPHYFSCPNRRRGAAVGEPTIEVLGVYRPRITDEMFREQFRILYGREASKTNPGDNERACREYMDSVVLIEVAVKNRDRGFDMGDFTQSGDDVSRDNWQVAWAERFLSSDGSEVVVEQFGKPPATGDLRVAFYLHFWDPAKALRSSYGDIMCPAPTQIPERLAKLVPYELLD
jgi:hypothetical protein